VRCKLSIDAFLVPAAAVYMQTTSRRSEERVCQVYREPVLVTKFTYGDSKYLKHGRVL
jgi:hypothetical protein